MRIGFILILVAGLGIAGFSGYLVMKEFESLNNTIAALRTEASKVVPTKTVYVAKADIRYGQELTKEDVKQFDFPTKLLPEGYFETEEALFGTEEEPLPRLVIRALDENDLIVAKKITAPGEDAGLVSRLGVGLRAFSLNVDVAEGTFVRPGDLVDVYWLGRGANREAATRLILDGVELIAINSRTDNSSRSEDDELARTITVAVSPQTVATLVQAQNTGKLLVSLRGLGDTAAVGELTVTESEFLGIEEEVEEIVVEERKCFTKVRRGTQIIETEIPCSE